MLMALKPSVPLGLLIIWLLAAAACSPDKVILRDLQYLNGRFITDRPVQVIPDRLWEPVGTSDGWSFLGSANLLCHVNTSGSEPLVLFFEPDQATTQHQLLVLWDEQRIASPVQLRAEGSKLVVPPDRLTPGLHTLTIKNTLGADIESVFTSVAWGYDTTRSQLRFQKLDLYRYLDRFLTLGLTGLSRERMAGCLLQGSQQASFALDLESDAEARFLLENFSRQEAVLTIQCGSRRQQTSLAPMTRQPVQLALGQGRHALTLTAAGATDGLFMFGAPYLLGQSPHPRNPVVLITMDTTRKDYLSPYSAGAMAETTPHIDAFAEHATVFDNAHATSPWTLPSHASIFTGKYPSLHGACLTHSRLVEEHETLAELFAAQRYFTAGFAGGELSSSRWGGGQGFLTYRDPDDPETRGDLLTDQVESFVRVHHQAPLFLFVNYFDPHGLYRAPDQVAARFGVPGLAAKIRHLPIWQDMLEGDVNAWARIISGQAEVNDDVVRYMRAAYQAEVSFMDSNIGRLLGLLKELELYDRAMIILVSDHGELLGEQGFFSHACRLDPELTEIPLLVKWPHQTRSRRVSELVSLVDLFATIVTMIPYQGSHYNGLVLPPPGHDSGHLGSREIVFSEEHETQYHPLFDNMKIASDIYAVQRSDTREIIWKGGITCAERSEQGWVEGPCPSSWQERLEQLATVAEIHRPATGSKSEPGISKEDERRLRALGYIQ
jgi:arylsulfatase A-like enzyme